MIVKSVATEVACTHCGLPVPAGLIEPTCETQFCCSGCAGAYELIRENGLDSFYSMAAAEPDSRTLQRTQVGSSRFVDFDLEIFQNKFARRIGESESEIELAIEGIHCAACIWLLEKLPTIVPGIVTATANWTKRTIRIRWRTDQVKLSTIASALNKLGYSPSPIQKNLHQDRWKLENRKHLIQIGIAAACAGNNMIISLALYLGMFTHMTSGMSQLLRISSCIVGLVALAWPGRTFLRSAWGALRTRTPHMDLPIALGLSVGTAAGLVNVIRGSGEIYFDSLSVLVFLLLIGRWVQFRQQSVAANSVELLHRMTPQKATKMVNGSPVETFVDLIQIGDTVQVHAGDFIPVDGVVLQGNSRVDESILTGESTAIAKAANDQVSAGTRNISSMMWAKATAVGSETRLGKIAVLIERASQDKPAVVQWANKIGGYFVTVVILLAMFTFVWWCTFDLNTAVERTVALLIVACPCALALATPLAIAVALGRAARLRIMIKDGNALQLLQRPGTIWLDKTGTITEGDLQVMKWYGDTDWLNKVAALEAMFSHPVANAILEFKQNLSKERGEHEMVKPVLAQRFSNGTSATVSNSEMFPGLGVKGLVGTSFVLAGNEKLLAKFGVKPSRQQLRISQRIIESGFSLCWVVADGAVVGVAALGDSIRPDAYSAISKLKHRGWKVGILSGDHQQVVDRVAKRLDIETDCAFGGVEPEKKLQTVEKKSNDGSIVMVGDGVNDSAALAAADVGIAVKNGAETSLSAAPVYLGLSGLNPILTLLSISDSTARVMRKNLAISLTYNVVFAVLAFLGHINPLVAAILMPISSITVVAMSFSAGRSTTLAKGKI